MRTDRTMGATLPQREEEATYPWMIQGSLAQSAILTPARKTSQPYDVYIDPNLFAGVRCLLRQGSPSEVGSADFSMVQLSGETTAPEVRRHWQAALRILKDLRAERVVDLPPSVSLMPEEVELVNFKPVRSRMTKAKVVSRRKGEFFRDFDLEF